jgi:hypothetical protein
MFILSHTKQYFIYLCSLDIPKIGSLKNDRKAWYVFF